MKAQSAFEKVLYSAILGIFCGIMCMLFSCNNDDEDPSPAELIIGKWTISDTQMDLMFNDKSLVQYLVEELNLTQVEAATFNNLLKEALLEFFEGTIEFKQDKSFVINIGGDTDYGTYILSADGKSLTFDAGTNDETVADIVLLDSSTLIIEMTQHAEEDLDEDGVMEHLIMKLKMNLTR
jgi:hypothetical protein